MQDRIDYNEWMDHGWKDMKIRLDKEMPQRRVPIFVYIIGLLLLILIGFIIYKYPKKTSNLSNPIYVEHSAESNKQLIKEEPSLENVENSKSKEQNKKDTQFLSIKDKSQEIEEKRLILNADKSSEDSNQNSFAENQRNDSKITIQKSIHEEHLKISEERQTSDKNVALEELEKETSPENKARVDVHLLGPTKLNLGNYPRSFNLTEPIQTGFKPFTNIYLYAGIHYDLNGSYYGPRLGIEAYRSISRRLNLGLGMHYSYSTNNQINVVFSRAEMDSSGSINEMEDTGVSESTSFDLNTEEGLNFVEENLRDQHKLIIPFFIEYRTNYRQAFSISLDYEYLILAQNSIIFMNTGFQNSLTQTESFSKNSFYTLAYLRRHNIGIGLRYSYKLNDRLEGLIQTRHMLFKPIMSDLDQNRSFTIEAGLKYNLNM